MRSLKGRVLVWCRKFHAKRDGRRYEWTN